VGLPNVRKRWFNENREKKEENEDEMVQSQRCLFKMGLIGRRRKKGGGHVSGKESLWRGSEGLLEACPTSKGQFDHRIKLVLRIKTWQAGPTPQPRVTSIRHLLSEIDTYIDTDKNNGTASVSLDTTKIQNPPHNFLSTIIIYFKFKLIIIINEYFWKRK